MVSSNNPDQMSSGYYGHAFTLPTGVWTLIDIPFSTMGLSWGTGIDKTESLKLVQAIRFETGNTIPPYNTGLTADLSVDNIEIYGSTPCPAVNTPSVTMTPTTDPGTATYTRTAAPSCTITRTITTGPSPFPSATGVWSMTFTPTATPTMTACCLAPSVTRTTTPTFTSTATATLTSCCMAVSVTMTPTITPTLGNWNSGPVVVYPAPGDNGGRNTCKDPNGNILVVGLEWNGPCGCYVMIIYRYLPDGTLDLSFGSGGRMVCPGPEVHYLWDDSMTIRCDSTGRICVAGYSDTCGGTCADVIIYRFLSDGTPDNSFNGGQCWRTYDNLAGGNGNDYVYDFDFDSSGKMVCTGKSWNGTDYDAIILRCNADGTPDTTFGPGGCRIISKCCGRKICCSGGKIYITGWSESSDPGCTGDCKSLCVWKYNEDGTPDATFTTSCYIMTAIGHKCCKPRSIIVTIAGKIIVTGSVDDGSGCTLACKKMIILVYNADGTPDTSFNGTGVLTDVSGTEGTCVIEVGGKIVVCFNRYNGSNSDCVVRRYNMDGTIDTTFNMTGEEVYDSGSDDYCYSILNLTICRLILAGHSFHIGTGYDMILWNIEDMCPPHTPVSTATPTFTATPTRTMTMTSSATLTNTPTFTPTFTGTPTFTFTVTATSSPTLTFTVTATSSLTPTQTATATGTPSVTATLTVTRTVPPTPTITQTVSCGFSATPVFSVEMIFNPGTNSDVIFNITSGSVLGTNPGLTVHEHGQCPDKPALTFTSSLIPSETMKYKVIYPKMTGYGDVDYVDVTYADQCGNSGSARVQPEKSVISQNDVQVFKNVINPDQGERCRISCRVYGDDHMSVKVYSERGTLIKEALNSDVSGSGWKDAIWDGTNTKGDKVASGVYVALVKCGAYTMKEKIAVVK